MKHIAELIEMKTEYIAIMTDLQKTHTGIKYELFHDGREDNTVRKRNE